MPYFPKQSTTEKHSASYDYTQWSSDGSVTATRKGVVHSTLPTPTFAMKRTGTNSSIPELIRLYGVGAFQITKKKVFAGYEFKKVVKLIWYRDRRGEIRSKERTVTVRSPRYITVSRARLVKRAMDSVKDARFYLKPNTLALSTATNVTVPKAIRVEKRYWTGSLGGYWLWKCKYDMTGPGQYAAPIGTSNILQWGVFSLQYIDTYSGDSVLAEQALRRLYSKVASDIPDYMTAAAESRELFRTLVKIAKTSIKLLRELKSLDIRRLSGRLKTAPEDISAIWLTWIYGVAPVISDITDTLDVIKRSDRTWRSFSTSVKHLSRSELTPPDVSLIGDYNLDILRTEKYGVILEGRLTIDKIYEDQVNWQTTLGTAYELVPFSFMLDWIVNISEYLKSSQIFEKQSYTAWRTSVQQSTAHFRGRYAWNPDYPYNYIVSDGDFEMHQNNINVRRRTLGSSLPAMPDIKVKKPSTDVLSLSRAINALAILVNSSNGFKRPPIL